MSLGCNRKMDDMTAHSMLAAGTWTKLKTEGLCETIFFQNLFDFLSFHIK